MHACMHVLYVYVYVDTNICIVSFHFEITANCVKCPSNVISALLIMIIISICLSIR